jgi:hypothetical protein
MLHRPLGKILPFWNGLRGHVALDDNAADSALPELDRQPHADRAASDDDDLRVVLFSVAHGQLEKRCPVSFSRFLK